MTARKIDLTVTLKPQADVASVAKMLTASGLEVSDIFEAINVIHGRATASLQSKLAKVQGVSDVSPTLGVGVGPPGADPS